jgi:hypothetical protein
MAPKKTEDEMMYVRSGNPGRIGMAEVDDKHPGGSVTVTARCAKVAKTAFAMYQLQRGELVECTKMSAAAKKEADEAAEQRIKDNPREEVYEDEADEEPAAPAGTTGNTGATGASGG